MKIVFGTDVGGFAWTDPIAQEFDRMVEFGMTPMEAIHAATSRAAEMLGKRDELGVDRARRLRGPRRGARRSAAGRRGAEGRASS